MGRLTPWKWVSDQLRSLPPISEYAVDMSGKTVVVVGANTGLGLATAQHFAELKAKRVILACRDDKKAQRAAQIIRDATNHEGIECWSLDLSKFASIKAFADRFEREESHLDILIENASIWLEYYEETEDGWERSLQVNYLGPILLALLLLPSLMKAPKDFPSPRLVIVGSEAQFFVPSFPEGKSEHILYLLSDKEHCKKTIPYRYAVTKLLNMFFTRALASRIDPPPTGTLTVTTVNPGFNKTEIGRSATGIMVWALKLATILLARKPEYGSRTIMWAALAGKPGEVHGRYTSSCQVEEESDVILKRDGPEVEEKLWKETIEILSKVDGRVQGIVAEYLNRS